jgi:hypothetical protein
LGDIAETILAMHNESLIDCHNRLRSWDHCYSFFQSGPDDDERASLHLAFYLASWGMYRGSSFLLQKDYLIHLDAVKKLRDTKLSSLNKLSFEEYSKNTQDIRKQLFDLMGCIKMLYDPNDVTDTSATKILLGTLGCIPAYDQFVVAGLREKKLSFSNLNDKNFKEMMSWCLDHRDEFEQAKKTIQATTIALPGYSFDYPIMKIIDMYFWSIGKRALTKQPIN